MRTTTRLQFAKQALAAGSSIQDCNLQSKALATSKQPSQAGKHQATKAQTAAVVPAHAHMHMHTSTCTCIQHYRLCLWLFATCIVEISQEQASFEQHQPGPPAQQRRGDGPPRAAEPQPQARGPVAQRPELRAVARRIAGISVLFGFRPVFTEKTEIPETQIFENRTEYRSNRVDRYGSVFSVRF